MEIFEKSIGMTKYLIKMLFIAYLVVFIDLLT